MNVFDPQRLDESEVWSVEELHAARWPDSIIPSQWAEQNRILPGSMSSEPGPWRNERTPYLAGIMDAFARGAEEVFCIKAAQIGWSEALRNILGFWIDHDPGPTLLVMPDEKSARELMDERIRPLIEYTPAVQRHLTSRAWDVQKSVIKLDSMTIHIGWAGSSQALKSRPIRYLLLDEPDEYPAISGPGGDPISKGMKRVTTYAAKKRAVVLAGGTPTSRIGNMWKLWSSCTDQRHFWVPCPHCGIFQTLNWKNVKWSQRLEGESRAVQASRIQENNQAWYECDHCKKQINEYQKPAMLKRGVWAGADQVVKSDGSIAGPSPKSRRVGFKISAIYSPWVSFAKLAAEWIEAQEDTQKLCDFINQRLAEPFEEERARPESQMFLDRAFGSPEPLVIPAWAQMLVATADTQGNDEKTGYFWYVTRAWGFNYRSQLIDFGIARTKEELKSRCLERQLPFANGVGSAAPQLLFVDSGGPRWNEVYQFAQNDLRIHPTKGASVRRTAMVQERPQKNHNVILWEIDTQGAKDQLYSLIRDPDITRWMVNQAVTTDYARQMSSEAFIWDPVGKKETWVEIIHNSNHIWDCEAMQVAVAWRYGMGMQEPQSSESPVSSFDKPANPLVSHKGKW